MLLLQDLSEFFISARLGARLSPSLSPSAWPQVHATMASANVPCTQVNGFGSTDTVLLGGLAFPPVVRQHDENHRNQARSQPTASIHKTNTLHELASSSPFHPQGTVNVVTPTAGVADENPHYEWLDPAKASTHKYPCKNEICGCLSGRQTPLQDFLHQCQACRNEERKHQGLSPISKKRKSRKKEWPRERGLDTRVGLNKRGKTIKDSHIRGQCQKQLESL